MTPIHKRAPETTRKQRQREVEQHLAMFGLRRGPHRLVRNAVAPEEDHIRKLRSALEGLGPVFVSFGLYLSTRVDLLAARECLELASLVDRAEASPTAAIRTLLEQELGSSPEDAYLAFEEDPFASSLLHQQHQAWLKDGQAVTVKLIHPEAEEFLRHDLQLLRLLKGAFAWEGWTDSKIESAIDDFGRVLHQRTDFIAQARALATLANDTEVFGVLRVPLVLGSLSTSRMLTVERLPGEKLDDLLKSLHVGQEKLAAKVDEEDRYSLARRLCAAWLRQALLGSLFAAEPSPGNITILPNRQIAFSDGALVSLTPEAKAHLWDYLIAAVTENPDLACSCLLKELTKDTNAVSEDELRQRFRQIVPFRDSEWAFDGANNNLAECLFLHWRLASERGYLARPGLPSFYRGLFVIATVAQQLVPDRDAFQEALQDVRLLAGVEKFREMLSARELGNQMETYFGIMMDLPQRLDEVLTLAAEGRARLKVEVPGASGSQSKRASSTIVMGLLFALSATIVLAHRFGTGVNSPWSSRISTLAFVLLGAMVLRAIGRSR